MTDVDIADDWLDDGRSGRFTADARAAAIATALPLLASYFATGTDTLGSQNTLAIEPDDQLGELLEFIQIRVLLAAAEQVEPMLRSVLDRPSFRYDRVKDESIGVIRGRLDTVTYLRRRHEVTAPRRFPVVNVVRSYVLPENVMATWAALAIAGALKRVPLHRLPPDAPERRRAERASELMRRLAKHSALDECTDTAARVWRNHSQSAVVERARSRIRSGRVPNAACYESLANWVDAFRPRDVALDPGNVAWMFYGDDSFDTRLFELWSLHQLIVALTEKLGEPTLTRLLVDRSQGAVAEWVIGEVHIEVWFQAGLARINVGDPRWAYDPRDQDEVRPTGRFGGIPDISVVVHQPGQPRRPVLLDPKLRHRKTVPGGEIYKIIGYFGNLPTATPNRGAIIFHGPSGTQRSYRITDGGSGEILAVAVDPLDQDNTRGRFADLAEFVIAAIPASTMTRAQGPADPNNAESVEEWVDTVQQQAVDEMAAAISPDALERSAKALRANLLDTWDRLDGGTQRMLATAEFFGGGVTPAMDHSGPLLGLAAGCERLIRSYVTSLAVPIPGALTFGRLLRFADDACQNVPGDPAQPLRAALQRNGVNVADLHDLITDLFRLNSDYRIPAAHADVLEEAQWFAGRAAILLGGNAALTRMVNVLGLGAFGEP
jgi:hypothetical protein